MFNEVISTSSRLIFSDLSNHRSAKYQMVITGLALPIFVWLTFVGFSHGAYLWVVVMGSFVVVASMGWFRAFV